MEKLRRVKEILSTFFLYSNVDELDEDFQYVLQVFYFYGFYKTSQSRKRALYGFLMFTFLVLTVTLGALKDIIESMTNELVVRALMSVPLLTFYLGFTVQVAFFMKNQKQVVDLIKGLHVMSAEEDESVVNAYRKMSIKLVRFYKNFVYGSAAFLVVLYTCGLRIYKFIMPVVYDYFAEGPFFYPLLFINIVHGFSIVSVFVVCDLIHILCIIRVGANLELLALRIRQCTSQDDPMLVKKEFIACIERQWKIAEQTKMISALFNPFFTCKVWGTVIALVCLFFVVMNIRFLDGIYLPAVLGLFLSLLQIASLCFVGQWFTNKFDDILDASYECNWIEQSKSFKSSLIILRTVSQRTSGINVVNFKFTNESFYQILYGAYNYYNNMKQTLNTIGSKNDIKT